MTPPIIRELPELNAEMDAVSRALDAPKKLFFINFGGDNYANFHLMELQTAAELCGIQYQVIEPYIQPFCFFTAQISLSQLDVLCRMMTQAKHFGRLAAYAPAPFMNDGHVHETIQSEIDDNKIQNFSMQANFLGTTESTPAKIAILNQIQQKSQFIAIPADLSNPQAFITLLYDRGTNPSRFVFGISLAYKTCARKQLINFALQKRKFLGPTSMDHELAAMMLLLAKATPGSVILDPFCGTCSILVAAAARGCVCLGADFDIKIIRGKETTYIDNFDQYNLHYPDLIWQDVHNPGYFRSESIDCIVTDPPYNLRASTRILDNSKFQNHFTASAHQSTMGIYLRTVDYAAQLLRVDGRLVFWLPVPLEGFTEDDLPQNPCFKIIGYPIQVLNSKYGRRLVILEKITKYMQETVYLKEDVCFNNIRDKLGYKPLSQKNQ